MKYLALTLIALAVLACTPGTSQAVRKRPIDRAVELTVELFEGRGTYCTAIITRHLILTAAHCVEDSTGVVQVRYHDDSTGTAAVVATWEEQDLAALVPNDRKVGRGVRIGLGKLRHAQPITVIGHSLGSYMYNVTRGVISNPRIVDGLTPTGLVFYHDAGSLPGNSGGPVLDSQGRLIGILSFGIIKQVLCTFQPRCLGLFTTTHIHGAVHLESIRTFLSIIKPLI